jgi:hypothetical protein
MFEVDGSVVTEAFVDAVVTPLERASVFGFCAANLHRSHAEILDRTRDLTIADVRTRIRGLEAAVPPTHELLTSRLATQRRGQRGREWRYFEERRARLPDDAAACERMHARAGQEARARLAARFGDQPGAAELFMREKTEASILRKMAAKGLHRWEIGDILGFFLCAESLAGVSRLARLAEDEYGGDILCKQHGFRDVLIDHQLLDRVIARRVFHIIRHDSAVCFELQIVSLRQLIYLHLSHPSYIGTPYSESEQQALHAYGDRAYLLDLAELVGSPLR